MRIKLSLLPPFASNKFLLSVPADIKTITDLKKHLIRSLSAVAQHVNSYKELILEIEGFELLGGSGLEVIEQGDVVGVRLAPSTSNVIAPPESQRPTEVKSAPVLVSATTSSSEKRAKRKSLPLSRLSELASDTAQPSKKKRRISEPPNVIVNVSEPKVRTRTAPPSTSPAKAKVKAKASPPSRIVTTQPRPMPDKLPTKPAPLPVKIGRSPSTSSSSSSSSSPSSSSSSSFSSSSSDSESDSDSVSSSSSSDSSSSSSSSSPSTSPQKGKGAAGDAFPVLAKSELRRANGQAHVPPGQGKSETQNRNLRRRKARQLKKAAAAAAAAENAPPSSLTAGTRTTTNAPAVNGTTTFTASELPVPKDMSNRNKKKGFLKEMRGVQGTKIVFHNDVDGGGAGEVSGGDVVMDQDGGAASTSATTGAAEATSTPISLPAAPQALPTYKTRGPIVDSDAEPSAIAILANDKATPRSQAQHQHQHQHQKWKVVPPSEMTDLPSNIFVTSAEFPWVRSPGGGREKKKRRLNGHSQTNGHAYQDEDEDEQQEVRNEYESNGAAEEEEMNGLTPLSAYEKVKDAGEDEQANSGAPAEAHNHSEAETDEALWERAEGEWEVLPPLTGERWLREGQILASQELELDMITFSPELKIHLARVLAVDTETGQIKLEKFRRPVLITNEEWADEYQYGSGVPGGDGQEEMEEDQVVIIALDSEQGGRWRVVA